MHPARLCSVVRYVQLVVIRRVCQALTVFLGCSMPTVESIYKTENAFGSVSYGMFKACLLTASQDYVPDGCYDCTSPIWAMCSRALQVVHTFYVKRRCRHHGSCAAQMPRILPARMRCVVCVLISSVPSIDVHATSPPAACD